MNTNKGKIITISVLFLIAVVVGLIIFITVSIKTNKEAEEHYSKAVSYMQSGEYTSALGEFEQVSTIKKNYKDSNELHSKINSTLEATKQAGSLIKEKKYKDAAEVLGKTDDCSEKDAILKQFPEILTKAVNSFISENDYVDAYEMINVDYAAYKSVSNATIEEIENANSSLAENCAAYAKERLESGDYKSLKNALLQLKTIDSSNENIPTLEEAYNKYITDAIQQANKMFNGGKGDIDNAEKTIKLVLELEQGNTEAKKLSENIRTYREALNLVNNAEKDFNNGKYESALNTINSAFAKSEMVKNNYTELYNKINSARQAQIEEERRAQEEAKRKEEERQRAEQEAKMRAENERIATDTLCFLSYNALQQNLKDPSSLKIYSAQIGTTPKDGRYVLFVDYGANNSFNASVRSVAISILDMNNSTRNGEKLLAIDKTSVPAFGSYTSSGIGYTFLNVDENTTWLLFDENPANFTGTISSTEYLNHVTNAINYYSK